MKELIKIHCHMIADLIHLTPQGQKTFGLVTSCFNQKTVLWRPSGVKVHEHW